MANDWRSDYVLTEDDLNTLADLVTAGDPRAMQVPNGTVAALIAMLRDAEAERDAARSELTEILGHVRETEWGSGRDESYVKVCGAPNDAYDYARAYGERVFTRKLYAGPWEEDHDDD